MLNGKASAKVEFLNFRAAWFNVGNLMVWSWRALYQLYIFMTDGCTQKNFDGENHMRQNATKMISNTKYIICSSVSNLAKTTSVVISEDHVHSTVQTLLMTVPII